MRRHAKSLPRLARWLLKATVPPQRVEAIAADLADDYAMSGRTRMWLAREVLSVIGSYLMARVTALRRSTPMLTRDIRIVMRGLRRGGSAVVAGAALLSVGIAAVLLTAGLVDALLFRQVSATHGSDLRRVVALDPQNRPITRFSLTELRIISEYVGDSADLAAVYLQPVVIRVNDADVQTMAEIVEGAYFSLTGMQTLLGRPLFARDAAATAPAVVVLAKPFWQQHLGGDPNVLGKAVKLNGATFAVVGVADRLGSPSLMGASVDAWVSIAHADPLVDAGWRTNIRDRWFTLFALPHQDRARLESTLRAAVGELSRLYVDPWRERRLQTLDATVMVGSQRTAATTLSLVLSGLAILILSSAASNVSGLLIARAAANQRSAAIHMSIGAGRALIIRRQLIEGALIGVAAGALALALYAWARAELTEVAVLPTLAFRLDLPLSAAVVWLALGSGLAAGASLALGPAIWSARVDITGALRDGDPRGGSGVRTTRLRKTLVAAQIALSLVLVVGAAYFVRSLDALANVDLGFSRGQLVAMDFDVEPVMKMPGDVRVLARDALARVNSLPGIAAAAMSNRAPVDQSTPTVELTSASDRSRVTGDVTVYLATARYFDTVGMPILKGRAFTEPEVDSAADVVIVNEAAADRLWPGGDAVERSLLIKNEPRPLRVVGVARNSKYRTLTESARPHIYRPTPPRLGLTLLARTQMDPREALRLIQRELDAVGPGVVGFFPRTFDDHVAVQLLPTRVAAYAAAVLGVFALVLSAAALYALVCWFVVLRRREMGVRMALGASPGEVRRLVVGQALSAALPGVIAGVLLTIALAFFARSALFGVGPADPVALGSGIAALLLVVLVAGYIPSRAATALDPVQALRQ